MMTQLRLITGNMNNFEERVNSEIKKIKNHGSHILNSIEYNTCIITTINGVEVQYSAFIEIEVENDYEEDEDDDYEDEDEDEDEEEDSYLHTLNIVLKNNCPIDNSQDYGCR